MPAPKGNKFAIGNSGREKQFKSVAELQEKIDEYFKECDSKSKIAIIKGIPIEIEDKEPYTVEGLCEILDCDRRTLLNYEKQEGYEEYFHTIKKAKLKVEKNKVTRALKGEANPAFSIFDLSNNSDYVNVQRKEHTGADGKPLFDKPINPKEAKEYLNKLNDEI